MPPTPQGTTGEPKVRISSTKPSLLKTVLHYLPIVAIIGVLLLYPWASVQYYRHSTESVYPLSMQQMLPLCQKQRRCVFVVSMGRSGSTALMDALNQIPGVYVRGENWNMMQYLYNLDQVAQQNSVKTDVSILRARAQKKRQEMDKKRKEHNEGSWVRVLGHAGNGTTDPAHSQDVKTFVDEHVNVDGDDDILGPRAEKRAYEEFLANGNKPAWFSNFQQRQHECAASSYFKNLYGYGDFGEYVVGFKEIRHAENLDQLLRVKDFNPWLGNRASNATYHKRSYLTYERYLNFLRGLCHDSKVLFNMRRNVDYSIGQGFYKGRGQLMEEIAGWMERYRARVGGAVARVIYYEDMFDPSTNATLGCELATWKKREGIDLLQMDMLRKYGDIVSSMHGVGGATGAMDDELDRGIPANSTHDHDPASRYAAGLPARFRPPSPPAGSPAAVGNAPHVDPRVAEVVRKWVELKETRGMVITQDLRTRQWWKSPDMMLSMLEKFNVDAKGTLLGVERDLGPTRTEARALWAEYEEQRSKERKRMGGKIEFSKQAAVEAALAAAREHAAKKERNSGKRQKR